MADRNPSQTHPLAPITTLLALALMLVVGFAQATPGGPAPSTAVVAHR